MAKQQTSKRQARKSIVEYFDQRCRVERFDIQREIRLLKGRSRIRGVLAAMGIYLLGFALSYYAWANQLIAYELFYKVTWIILLPATVAGIMVWLLSFNREENVLRGQLAQAMREVEMPDGFLWRFAPLLQATSPTDYDTKTVINLSQTQRLEEVEPDDYARAMLNIHALLQNAAQQPLPGQVLTEVEGNIRSAQVAH